MNSELQKWYKALEEADRKAEAGDEQAKKDAYEIADTIRQLEAQGEEAPYQADLTDPILYGAFAGLPPVIRSGANLFRAEAAPPAPKVQPPAAAAPSTSLLQGIDIDRQFEGTPGPGGSGRSRDIGYNVRSKEISEASKEAEKNLLKLEQKGIISSTNVPQIGAATKSGVLLTPGAVQQLENAPPPPRPTISQQIGRSAAQTAKAIPGATLGAASNFPLRSTIAGVSGGALLADAYNYRELAKEAEAMGDQKAAAYYNSMAAISAGGSVTGTASAYAPYFKPKTRALAIPSAGLAMYNYLQSQKGYPKPGEKAGVEPPPSTMKSIMQGRAAGGAIKGYQKGKLVTGGLDLIVGRGPIIKPAAIQTVRDPRRMDFPGIYERPDIIAQRAVENTAPESPLLKQLFGVTRQDLYEMSKRKGNMPGVIPGAAKNPKGSAAAEAVMTPQNEQRILDIMSEIQTRAPGMYQGMHGWYVMDPEYQRLVQLVGKDEAGRLYKQLNVFGGIESPNMPVPNEFRRASAAHMLAEQGRFPEWKKYGGLRALEKSGMPDYPSDLLSVPGRVGHQRASGSQEKFLLTGHHGMDSPKAPPYIEASSVPELGFQTDLLVGDAHLSRGVGLADVRTGKSTAESVSTPELQQIAPWWREKIAGEMGTEAVPAQAILWGGLGPYTGVKTAVGAPKLELHAIEIGDAAKRLNVSPETARDLILMGKERAGRREGGYIQ